MKNKSAIALTVFFISYGIFVVVWRIYTISRLMVGEPMAVSPLSGAWIVSILVVVVYFVPLLIYICRSAAATNQKVIRIIGWVALAFLSFYVIMAVLATIRELVTVEPLVHRNVAHWDIFKDTANMDALWLGNKAQKIWIETGYYLNELTQYFPK